MTVSLPLLKDPSFNERQRREQLGLGQDDVATALQTAIDGLSTPACVALYGAWGSGKTTLLHHAYSQLRDPNKSIHRVAWFDPWEYEQRGNVLEALIFRIAQQLVPTDEKVHQFKTLALKVARGLGSLTLRVGAAAAAGTLLGRVGLELKESFGTLLQETKLEPEVFDKLASYHDEVAETKQNFKALVDTALGEDPERKLVIFLDDLDRCLPETVVKIIEAVKLLLCGDHGCRVCFIFGLDRHVVGEAIQHRYPGSTSYTGENYLEKIFDLALEVPKPTIHDIDAFVAQILKGNPSLDTAISKLGGAKKLIAGVLNQPIFANPRVIRRFLNRLAIYNNSAAQPISDTGFLTWLAGSERFRSFRLFFVNATDEERQMAGVFLSRRASLSQNLAYLGSPPDAVVRTLSVPGTTTFFQLLGAGIDQKKIDDITRFDSELRKYGL